VRITRATAHQDRSTDSPGALWGDTVGYSQACSASTLNQRRLPDLSSEMRTMSARSRLPSSLFRLPRPHPERLHSRPTNRIRMWARPHRARAWENRSMAIRGRSLAVRRIHQRSSEGRDHVVPTLAKGLRRLAVAT